MSNEKCTLSIIVPVYNVEKYLPRCLNSILNQTFQDYEMIIVDDSSTDQSWDICRNFKNQDSRVKILQIPHAGLSAARNAGLDIAVGKYIGFVDSDDWCDRTMYEKLVEAAERTGADIICCGYREINKRDKISEKFTIPHEKTYTNQEALKHFLLTSEIAGHVWDKLYRADFVQNHRFIVGDTHQDYAFNYPLLARAKSVEHIGVPLYFYRRNQESISFSTDFHIRFENVTRHWKSLEDFVREQFPDLVQCLPYHAAGCFLYLHSYAIQHCKKYPEKEKRTIVSNIRRYFIPAMKHPAWTVRFKLIYLSAWLGIYKPLWKIRNAILNFIC